jgi:hypothetical protein
MEPKIEKLQLVLNDFVKAYQKKPFRYFYEEDIRADFLRKLCSEKIFDIKLPITNSNEWLKDYVDVPDNEKNISGIRAEYPSTSRFDIAYIKPSNDFNHYIYNCAFAIELKLSQKDNKNSDFKSDIIKLFDYKKQNQDFLGIAINFEQNPHYDKNVIFKDYNNYNNLKLNELTSEIELLENSINYFFISPKFILGGVLN